MLRSYLNLTGPGASTNRLWCLRAHKALREVKVYNGARACIQDGDNTREVFVRATDRINGNGHWHDAAIVQFEVGNQRRNAPAQQLGYCRVYAAVELAGECLLFIRWYSDYTAFRVQGESSVFMNSHIRTLPALKWNPRTQTSDRSFGLISAALLRKAVWVVKGSYRPNCFWHIKHPQLQIHQNPEGTSGM